MGQQGSKKRRGTTTTRGSPVQGHAAPAPQAYTGAGAPAGGDAAAQQHAGAASSPASDSPATPRRRESRGVAVASFPYMPRPRIVQRPVAAKQVEDAAATAQKQVSPNPNPNPNP